MSKSVLVVSSNLICDDKMKNPTHTIVCHWYKSDLILFSPSLKPRPSNKTQQPITRRKTLKTLSPNNLRSLPITRKYINFSYLLLEREDRAIFISWDRYLVITLQALKRLRGRGDRRRRRLAFIQTTTSFVIGCRVHFYAVKHAFIGYVR